MIGLARGLILLGMALEAFVGLSGAADCSSGPHSAGGPSGYQSRPNPDRCEGQTVELQAYRGLELLGFTAGPLDFETGPNRTADLYRPARALQMNIRASSKAENFFYEMDALSQPNQTLFAWPLDVLAALYRKDRDIAIAAFTGTMADRNQVFYPVSLNSTLDGPLSLQFRTNAEGVIKLQFEPCAGEGANGAIVDPAIIERSLGPREVVSALLERRSGTLCLKATETFRAAPGFKSGPTQPYYFRLWVRQ